VTGGRDDGALAVLDRVRDLADRVDAAPDDATLGDLGQARRELFERLRDGSFTDRGDLLDVADALQQSLLIELDGIGRRAGLAPAPPRQRRPRRERAVAPPLVEPPEVVEPPPVVEAFAPPVVEPPEVVEPPVVEPPVVEPALPEARPVPSDFEAFAPPTAAAVPVEAPPTEVTPVEAEAVMRPTVQPTPLSRRLPPRSRPSITTPPPVEEITPADRLATPEEAAPATATSPAISAPAEPEEDPALALLASLPPPSGAPVQMATTPPAPTRRLTARRAVVAVRAVAVVLLVFVFYALYGSAALQGHDQRSLDNSTTLMRVRSPDIGLNQVVMASDSRGDLAKGPGVAGSGSLTSAQPLIIVGHRVTYGAPFRYLKDLGSGSVINLSRGSTLGEYTVDKVLRVHPGSTITVTAPTQSLVLVTADPPYGASTRLVVVAQRLGGAQTSGPVTVKIPALKGSPLDLFAAVLVLLLIGAGWSIRSELVRSWQSPARWGSLAGAVALTLIGWYFLAGAVSRVL
jgi:LPXTG-site transpeptidase (sortase) family protein